MERSIVDSDRIWAPWRYEYVSGSSADSNDPGLEPASWLPGADHECFLCRSAADYLDEQAARRVHLVPWRGSLVFTILNRFPYNNGHLMIAPRRHIGVLYDLTEDEHLEAMGVLAHLTQQLSHWIQAQGYNVGLNLGAVAGAGVPGHLHWHLVPRWPGDTNFMPVTASTQVIPQSLESLWQLLSERLQDFSLERA